MDSLSEVLIVFRRVGFGGGYWKEKFVYEIFYKKITMRQPRSTANYA
jgi:hypothetical protein